MNNMLCSPIDEYFSVFTVMIVLHVCFTIGVCTVIVFICFCMYITGEYSYSKNFHIFKYNLYICDIHTGNGGGLSFLLSSKVGAML